MRKNLPLNSDQECDPFTCTTGIHIDIDSGKTLNRCPICKIHHDDPSGSYRIIAMGANSRPECILQKDPGIFNNDQWIKKEDVKPTAMFSNDQWIKPEDKKPLIGEVIITIDRTNGDIYIGKVTEGDWFKGKHIDIGSFIHAPIDRFVWKAIDLL